MWKSNFCNGARTLYVARWVALLPNKKDLVLFNEKTVWNLLGLKHYKAIYYAHV